MCEYGAVENKRQYARHGREELSVPEGFFADSRKKKITKCGPAIDSFSVCDERRACGR